MTNEEKARELAAKFGFLDDCIGDEEERFKTAMEMAEWKEQQMINRAVGFLKLHMPFGEVSETLKNEVIEDFKKEMKKG